MDGMPMSHRICSAVTKFARFASNVQLEPYLTTCRVDWSNFERGANVGLRTSLKRVVPSQLSKFTRKGVSAHV